MCLPTLLVLFVAAYAFGKSRKERFANMIAGFVVVVVAIGCDSPGLSHNGGQELGRGSWGHDPLPIREFRANNTSNHPLAETCVGLIDRVDAVEHKNTPCKRVQVEHYHFGDPSPAVVRCGVNASA